MLVHPEDTVLRTVPGLGAAEMKSEKRKRQRFSLCDVGGSSLAIVITQKLVHSKYQKEPMKERLGFTPCTWVLHLDIVCLLVIFLCWQTIFFFQFTAGNNYKSSTELRDKLSFSKLQNTLFLIFKNKQQKANKGKPSMMIFLLPFHLFKINVLEKFWGHGKLRRKVQSFLTYFMTPHMCGLPNFQRYQSDWYIHTVTS